MIEYRRYRNQDQRAAWRLRRYYYENKMKKALRETQTLRARWL